MMDGVHAFWILVIGVATAVDGATYTTCEDGWMPFQGNCYLFGTNSLHFVEAEHYCRQHDGHLIEVNNGVENAFTKQHLGDLQHRCFWIGITDDSIENVWLRYTNREHTNFTDWDYGEPNHDGDCAIFGPSGNFQWADVSCTMNCSPLCKTEGQDKSAGIVGRR